MSRAPWRRGVHFTGSFSPAGALGLIRVGVLSAHYDQAEGARGLGRWYHSDRAVARRVENCGILESAVGAQGETVAEEGHLQ